MVQIEMENGKLIKIELYPDIAPETVKNFEKLVSEGFYDGLIFHRVIAGFMIQGGDPEGSGMGGPGYSIKGEFNYNGVENKASWCPVIVEGKPETKAFAWNVGLGNSTGIGLGAIK